MNIRWSGSRIPKRGEKFVSQVSYLYSDAKALIPYGTEMEVVGFDVEYGFLYAIALPTDTALRERAVKFCTGRSFAMQGAYVAGVDVEAWR